MSFASTMSIAMNVLLVLFALTLVAQICRISAALRSGKTYRLRWLILSIPSVLLLYLGMLLMPATPAVMFTSVAGALKTILCFILLLGGNRLMSLSYEARMALPKSDQG